MLRIVAKAGQQSGVWRVPRLNPAGRNYYLIVEAIAPDGSAVPLDIRNEESGTTSRASKWGLRVDEATFESIADDKRDDGSVQANVVGTKPAGRLDPEYSVPTTGATITAW